MKTCCFYGYESFEYVDLKDLKFFLRPRLMNFISKGVDTFLFGNGSDFEFLAWCYLQELKKMPQFSHIKLIGNFEPMTPNQLIGKFNRVELDYSKYFNNDFAFFDNKVIFLPNSNNNSNFNVSFLRDRTILFNADCVICYIEKDFGLCKRVEYDNKIYYANFRAWLVYRTAIALKKEVDNLIDEENIFFHINRNGGTNQW